MGGKSELEVGFICLVLWLFFVCLWVGVFLLLLACLFVFQIYFVTVVVHCVYSLSLLAPYQHLDNFPCFCGSLGLSYFKELRKCPSQPTNPCRYKPQWASNYFFQTVWCQRFWTPFSWTSHIGSLVLMNWRLPTRATDPTPSPLWSQGPWNDPDIPVGSVNRHFFVWSAPPRLLCLPARWLGMWAGSSPAKPTQSLGPDRKCPSLALSRPRHSQGRGAQLCCSQLWLFQVLTPRTMLLIFSIFLTFPTCKTFLSHIELLGGCLWFAAAFRPGSPATTAVGKDCGGSAVLKCEQQKSAWFGGYFTKKKSCNLHCSLSSAPETLSRPSKGT